MGRIITATLILLATFVLMSCGGTRTITETEIKRVDQPVLFCPKPPKTERPELAIHDKNMSIPDGKTWKSLPPEQKYKIVKAYKATIKELIDYSERLESVIGDYSDVSEDLDSVNQMMKFQGSNIDTTSNKQQ